MKALACIIARTSSSRLPDKVLLDVHGRCMIEHIIDRMQMVRGVTSIHICTSDEKGDERLRPVAERNGVRFYAGSLISPLDRLVAVAAEEKADCIVRITGDNVYTDPVYLEELLDWQSQAPVDYGRVENLPLGITAEVMGVDALRQCHAELDPEKAEYLMLYMFRPDRFRCRVLYPEKAFQAPGLTFTVDTSDDLERTRFITGALSDRGIFGYHDILALSRQREIPNVHFSPKGLIKLPAGEVMEYAEFRKEMVRRCTLSEGIQLPDGHYDSKWRELVS